MSDIGLQLVTRPNLRQIARWSIYPLSWALLIAMLALAVHGAIDLRTAWLVTTAILVVSYIVLERLVPYEARWSMTWRTFLADLKYLIAGAATMAILSAGLGLFAISISGQLSGPARGWPLWLQFLVLVLIFEAVQYSLHRIMHEARGSFGHFMWMVHVAHHLPERVYVVMHVVAHPLNIILTQGLAIILPIWLMGYDPIVVTAFLMINGMHGLISHFNVDARIGWLNYVFVGPELHRYHHSANLDEAKNYGATVPLYDLLFGTFVYRPGIAPTQLGIPAEGKFPSYGNYYDVLKLPVVRRTSS